MRIKPGSKPRWQERPRTTGYEVHIPKGDDAMRHYKRLKKKMTKDGFFQELRERTFYESRGTKRRKAKMAATRRYKRKMEKRKEELGF